MRDASHSVIEYGQAQLFLAGIMLMASTSFTIAALTTSEDVMSAAVYGADVVQFRAEAWSLPIVLASLLHLLGTKINGHWRWSPILRIIGSGLNTLFLLAFYWMAREAPDGDIIMHFNPPFTIAYGFFFAINIGDCARIGSRHAGQYQ